jgi:hypothetical protein
MAAAAGKLPNSICPDRVLTPAAITHSPAVVQATARWPVTAPTNQEPSPLLPPTNQQLVWSVRVGKVWKAPPANGSSSVTARLWAKKTLPVNMAVIDAADCKKLRTNVTYLLLMEQALEKSDKEEEQREMAWQLVFPPVRLTKKTKKLIRRLFCTVRRSLQ